MSPIASSRCSLRWVREDSICNGIACTRGSSGVMEEISWLCCSWIEAKVLL